jgi:pimeloyl-ACP methyl ester carboxylesterase
LDPARQAKIKGWIEVDGAHIKLQSPIAFNFTKNFVLNYANNKLADPGISKKERKLWEEGLAFETAMTEITKENQRPHTDWVGKAGGYYHDPKFGLQFADVMDLLLFSKNDMAAVTPNQIQAISAPNQLNPAYSDYTPVMYKITIPSLILSGRFDGILTVDLVPYAINALGTPAQDKYSFIFENSAHNPFDEEPELFYNKVEEFVEKYK